MMLGHLPAKCNLLKATTSLRSKAFPKPQGTCLLTPTSPRHVTARPYSSSPSSSLDCGSSHKSSAPARSTYSGRSVLLPSQHPSLLARPPAPSCTSSNSRGTYATNSNAMATVKVGDAIPQGTFTYIPWSAELESNAACGIRAYPLVFSRARFPRSLHSDFRALNTFRLPQRSTSAQSTSFVRSRPTSSDQAEHGRVEGQEGRPRRRPRRVHRASSLLPSTSHDARLELNCR